MHQLRQCTLVLLAIAAVPALAADGDLVSVSTHVTYPTAYRGGANEGEVLITNNTSFDVRARLDLRVVYSDGTVQRLTGISDPGTIPPGGAYVLSVFFIIPEDAALGTAAFVADVAASGGGLQEKETSSSTFEVAAP